MGVSSQLALLDENRGVGRDGDVSSRISLLRVSIFRYATLKRSTEILSTLPLMSSAKYLGFLSTILYGPWYTKLSGGL